MAVYRNIQISFWQDPFVIDLTPEEKYFYIYLMTNSKTSQCGIYEIPKRVIELETGYNRDTIDKLLQRFVDYRKIEYNDETKEILIRNWIKHNSSKSPKVVSCIKSELSKIKYKGFIKSFARLWIQYGYSIDSLCIDLGEEEEKEKEKEKEEEETAEKKPKAKPKSKKIAPAKSNYGEYSNVLLTEEEYNKLLIEIPNASEYIEKLSSYMESTGKTYKSHIATIRNWFRNDKDKGKTETTKQKGSAIDDFIKEMEARNGSTGVY